MFHYKEGHQRECGLPNKAVHSGKRVLCINIYLICMKPKNSQANISSSYSPLILFYSPPANVCGWQDANLLHTLPEGMDRRSALYCTIENNNSFLLLTNTHTGRHKERLKKWNSPGSKKMLVSLEKLKIMIVKQCFSSILSHPTELSQHWQCD